MDILISEDVWVAGRTSDRVLINPVTVNVPEKVSELFVLPDRKWNDSLDELLFSEAQGDTIKAIPLTSGHVDNQVACPHHIFGIVCGPGNKLWNLMNLNNVSLLGGDNLIEWIFNCSRTLDARSGSGRTEIDDSIPANVVVDEALWEPPDQGCIKLNCDGTFQGPGNESF
ncbi:hypothetical protein ACFE04_029831 [Oxalis oulophora]